MTTKIRRLLLIEDGPTDALLFQGELAGGAGPAFNVDHVRSMHEALLRMADAAYDVAVLDLDLTGSQGMANLRRLRHGHEALPVVLLTGQEDEALALQALNLGAQDLLVKPLARGGLLTRVLRQAIEREAAARTIRESAVAAAESEAMFRAIFEHAGIGLGIVDFSDGRIMRCNAALAQMLGFSVDELGTMSVQDISHPDDYGEDLENWRNMVEREGFRYQMEKRYRCKDGRWLWGLLTTTLVKDEAGAPKFLIGMVEDISERKRAEEALRSTKRRLQTLIDSAPLAILGLDLTGRVMEWNGGATRMFGWTPEEAIGHFCPTVPVEGRADFENMIQRVQTDGFLTSHACIRRKKSGEHIQVSQSSGLLCGDSGAPVGAMVILEDITARKQAEEQLLRAQRLQSIGTLAGGIAHDLNNMLSPILMGAEFLMLEETNETRRNLLATMLASGARGADLVRQVLAFARGLDGQRLEVRLESLVQEAQKMANNTFLKSIQVKTRIGPGLWPVLGDPTQLYQVILNLAVNARDAMPHGGVLTLSAENLVVDEQDAEQRPGASPGPYILLQLKDTGVGMVPEVLDRIFEPFFTTKVTGHGTGLGLSTSIGIVRSHGGFMNAHSEPGRGSRFQVFLPALTTALSSPGASAEVPLPRGKGEWILVVDDEASVREVLQQTLEGHGYRVMVAADGTEALALFAKSRHDIAVVIMDLMMPMMDGPTTIRVLRKLDPEVRVIAASGLPMHANLSLDLDEGVSGFLPKPYTASVLLTMLREVLPIPKG